MKQRALADRPRIIALLALALFAGAASAQQQLTFAENGDASAASITDAGDRVAFQSTADLADGGDNADGNAEIFIVDADGSDPIQLTDSEQASEAPSIAGDGRRVAFVSAADFTGDNADGGPEVFVVETQGGEITQVTDSTQDSGIQAPSLSEDGARVAFSATGDLRGDGSNGDGSREVFVIDTDGGDLIQLSDGPQGSASRYPAITADGGRVAFASDADPNGDNSDDNSEIFVAASDGSGDPRQLTQTEGGESRRPSIADDGRIAFESSAELETANPDNDDSGADAADSGDSDASGSNTGDSGNEDADADNPDAGSPEAGDSGDDDPDTSADSGDDGSGNDDAGNGENNDANGFGVYVIDADGSRIIRISDTGDGDAGFPQIAADGGAVVFESSAEPNGGGEIFIADSDGGESVQLSDSSGAAQRPDIAGDGGRVVYQSGANPTGNNADGNTQIFVVDPSDSGFTGGGDDDEDGFKSIFCNGQSGCAFCDDNGTDSDLDSTPDNDSNGDDNNNGNFNNSPGIGTLDPTFSLLTLLAVIRIRRRRPRTRRTRDPMQDRR